VLLVVIGFLGVGAPAIHWQSDVWETLRSYGLGAAKEEHASSPSRDEATNVYRDAWFAYREGDLDTSRELVQILLGNPEYRNQWGNCYYLMAILSRETGNLDDAERNYLRAENFAIHEGTQALLPHVYHGLSRIYLMRKAWDELDVYSERMIEHSDFLQPHYHTLHAWKFAIRDGDFDASLMHARLAEELFVSSGNAPQLIHVYADLAIFNAFAGETGEVLRYVALGRDLLSRGEHERFLHVYSMLPYFALQKCLGFTELSKIEDVTSEYSQSSPSNSLTKVLGILKTLECRGERYEDSR
jgi:hypothetical protein